MLAQITLILLTRIQVLLTGNNKMYVVTKNYKMGTPD
jgi:hypothetical protein